MHFWNEKGKMRMAIDVDITENDKKNWFGDHPTCTTKDYIPTTHSRQQHLPNESQTQTESYSLKDNITFPTGPPTTTTTKRHKAHQDHTQTKHMFSPCRIHQKTAKGRGPPSYILHKAQNVMPKGTLTISAAKRLSADHENKQSTVLIHHAP